METHLNLALSRELDSALVRHWDTAIRMRPFNRELDSTRPWSGIGAPLLECDLSIANSTSVEMENHLNLVLFQA